MAQREPQKPQNPPTEQIKEPTTQPAEEWGQRHDTGRIKEQGGKGPGPAPNEELHRQEKGA